MIDLETYKPEFNKFIDFFKKEVQSIRTNRAMPELVAHILVDAYGVKTPLEQLASITVPEPRLLVIQPWDKNLLKEIEKSITEANLGALPTIKGEAVYLNLPPLSEETRKQLVKILYAKAEQVRIEIRRLRDEIKSQIVKEERAKTITEDAKYRLLENLDKIVGQYIDEVRKITERKEGEIMMI
jgi:ribosome recycling factor